jgi:hypothetical protein
MTSRLESSRVSVQAAELESVPDYPPVRFTASVRAAFDAAPLLDVAETSSE